MHGRRLSGQYGRLSSFTTCWWAGEECRAAVMYGMHWQSGEPPLSAPISITFSAAYRNLVHICKGGCSFSVNAVVIRSHHLHTCFPKYLTTENNQGWFSDIYLYLHMQCCSSQPQLTLLTARVKCILSHIQCMFLLKHLSECMLFAAEMALFFWIILLFRSCTVYFITLNLFSMSFSSTFSKTNIFSK